MDYVERTFPHYVTARQLQVSAPAYADHDFYTLRTSDGDSVPEYPKTRLQTAASNTLLPQAGSIITVSSTSDSLRSVFPFDERLHGAGVAYREWRLFTTRLSECVRKLPRGRRRAIASGLMVGAMLLPVLGPVAPLMGWSTWRLAKRALGQEHLLQRLDLVGDLDAILHRWNASYFLARGVAVRLEIPDDRTHQDHTDWLYRSWGASKRLSRRGSSAVTLEYGLTLYWVEGLDKPRLVVTNLCAGHDRGAPPAFATQRERS